MEDKFSQHYNDVSKTYGSFAKKVEIQTGVPSIMRIIGGTNAFVSYLESWILCDDDKKRPFIIKNEQGKSPLYDMIGDKDNFYRGGFLESTIDPKTNKPKYGWQLKDPELFNLIMYNNNLGGADGSWKPRANYAFNVVLRNSIAEEGRVFNWCAENTHTMLLLLNPTGFKSLGDLKQMSGNFSEYDIAYLKTGTGFDTKHNIVKATPDDSGKNLEFNIAVIGPISEEELMYTRYSLERESALTPASKILERIGETVEKVSSVMGINWLERLEKEASYEKQNDTAGASLPMPTSEPAEPEWVSEGTANKSQEVASNNAKDDSPTTPAAVHKPVRVARVEQSAPQEPKSEGEKTEICYFCNEVIEAGSAVCPKCSNPLMEPCTDCGKPFHVSLTTCPHCGKLYDMAE